ncbi:hypothetical protein LSAT2_032581 [Lamellibrachia satsuma]|nr:hypothetical protein LSAT2_032581 [Lamellibrachia satsuma]
MDNTLPGDTTAGQNAAEGIRRKRYSQEGMSTLNDLSLLVLLILVAQSCVAWIFVKPHCGDVPYNRDTHICCESRIRERPKYWDKVLCCADQIYNPAAHLCYYKTMWEGRVVAREFR